MDDYFRLKTHKTKQRQPHTGTPQRQDKRKPWERSTHKRTQEE